MRVAYSVMIRSRILPFMAMRLTCGIKSEFIARTSAKELYYSYCSLNKLNELYIAILVSSCKHACQ